jgi:hypothetical protein
MKTRATLITSVFTLLVFGSACAHGDHKSTHGGVVGRGSDDIVVEFVTEKGTLNLYVEDEAGEPLATDKLTGTLTLISPNHPAREVKLVSTGPHRFSAPGIEPAAGDRLVARIKLPSGEEVESVALFARTDKPASVAAGAAASGGPGAATKKLP